MPLTPEEKLERRRERQRKYYLENREKILEYQHKYQLDNQEKIQKDRKRYYTLNKTKVSENNKRWKSKNPERCAALGRAWRAKNYVYAREQVRECHLRTLGFSPEIYQQRASEQGGLCAICGQKKKLCADHNHKTNMPRGLLCHNCNIALGLLGESLESLEKAKKYLCKYQTN